MKEVSISLESWSAQVNLNTVVTGLKNSNWILTRIFSVVWMIVILQTAVFGQAGSLDNTFATGGKFYTSLGTFNDGINAIAVQSDDKIVLGGYTQLSYVTSDFALIRCNADGTLDPGFGTGGIVITDVESRSQGSSVAIQSDGKILLGGFSGWYINLVRYNGDGTLDTGFGTGGKVITDVEGYYSEKCKSLTILSDGKILVGGYGQHSANDNPYFMLLRYNSDGSLDDTFGINGKVIGSEGKANSMVVQGDGKIILGGSFNFSFAMERYHTDGTIDNAFGLNGQVITPIGNSGEANSMSIQNDGRILLGGWSINVSNSEFALARYTNDGTLDNTFGVGGIALTAIGVPSPQNSGNALSVQNDGKILFAGSAKNSFNYTDFAAVRYENNGSLDGTFGTGGKVLTPMGNTYSTGRAMSIQGDGKMLLGGVSYIDSTTDFSVARYNTDAFGSVDESCCKEFACSIYPNPLNTSGTLQFNAPLTHAELKIYTMYGQEVMYIKNISDQEFVLSRSNLSAGTYFIRITEDQKSIATEKLVISDY
nr:T9SS type A sorting domain-containing protein [uncultured Fluviicola sp.]